jgi:cation diffusion facilitator family transporter
MAINPRTIRLSAIIIALIAGIIIFGVKLYAAHISNSSAIRSDALEGSVNILAAAFGLFSILFSEKPADHDHPYGHGKIEHFAAVFEGGLISLAGFLILIDTVSRYLNHSEPSDLSQGLLISFLAGVGNGIIGLTILMIGKKYDSTTLRADGLHLISDFWSTLGLGAGLGLALYTGWLWIDPLLAIVVGIMLFVAGYKVFIPSWNTLLDAVNPESIQKIVDRLNEIKLEPVITVHELKTQEFGRDAHVDLHLVVPEFFSIKDAHQVTDRIVGELQKTLGSNSLIHAHLDPCGKLYCTECSYENCPIRKNDFLVRKPLTVDSIVQNGPI